MGRCQHSIVLVNLLRSRQPYMAVRRELWLGAGLNFLSQAESRWKRWKLQVRSEHWHSLDAAENKRCRPLNQQRGQRRKPRSTSSFDWHRSSWLRSFRNLNQEAAPETPRPRLLAKHLRLRR